MNQKLPRKFGEKLAEFLINKVYRHYDVYDKKDELKNIHQYIDANLLNKDYFHSRWCLGGESRSYTGSSWPVSAEPEPELMELDDFLIEHYPNIGFLQYKIISRNIEKTTEGSSDYYGGNTTYGLKKISFKSLADALVELKLIDDNDLVSQQDLKDHIKNNIYNKSWYDQKVEEKRTAQDISNARSLKKKTSKKII